MVPITPCLDKQKNMMTMTRMQFAGWYLSASPSSRVLSSFFLRELEGKRMVHKRLELNACVCVCFCACRALNVDGMHVLMGLD